jgi:hypothetical protein
MKRIVKIGISPKAFTGNQPHRVAVSTETSITSGILIHSLMKSLTLTYILKNPVRVKIPAVHTVYPCPNNVGLWIFLTGDRDKFHTY